ncbi:MAG: hypothetical protein QW808_03770 [Desulfurococcaceae archaeon]
MSRFTFIAFNGGFEQAANDEPKDLHDRIKQLVAPSYPLYHITRNTYLILSNGLGRELHYNLYSQLSSKYPSVKILVASITHENPIYTAIKFSKLANKADFYYEEGAEKEYFIGYFTPIGKPETDIRVDIARRVRIAMEIGLYLLNLGSLPLSLDATGVIAVLNRDSIDQMEALKHHVNISIGVDFSGARAVEKAVRGTAEAGFK